jgi:osmoprotectant transport system permease protein
LETWRNFFIYIVENQDKVLQALFEHVVYLVLLPVTLGVLVAVPLGILAARSKRAHSLVMGPISMIQTIPGLALIALMIPLGMGIGYKPAVTALFLYSLLPIVRNTYTGLKGIHPSVREAATAMGLPPWKMLWRVELPLAVPVIMAGIRTSMVVAVGYGAIAALVGAGGLGVFITRGLGLMRDYLILVGAVPSALLAIVIDLLLGRLEVALTPKGLRAAQRATRAAA